jgi:hypothetical protein
MPKHPWVKIWPPVLAVTCALMVVCGRLFKLSRDKKRKRLMSLTYPDQNALIALGVKARSPEFRKKLDGALESGSLSVVVSTWHLIETANTRNLAMALELADFIDSLRPAWLLERRDAQKLEVEEDFCRFLNLECPTKPRVTTRSAVVAALNRQNDAPRFDIPSRAFVKQWIEHPEQLKVLEETYKKGVDTLLRLREIAKEGKLTDEMRRRVDEIFVTASLPKVTPAGLEVGRDVKLDYVRQVKIETLPTFAIETAISEHEWVSQGGADRNTLIDKFHLISALPYVDVIVSNDKFFHEIYPWAQKTGYVKAKLVGNDEFLNGF